MDSEVAALRDERRKYWEWAKNTLEQSEGRVFSDGEADFYQRCLVALDDVDHRLAFLEKSKSREPVITHQQVGYDVVDVDVEYDKHKFAEQMDMVEKSVGYDTAVIPDPVAVKKVQQIVGVPIDGKFGPMTAMQMLTYAHNEQKRMDIDYERYKEEFATTGDEDAFKKMLDCVYMT